MCFRNGTRRPLIPAPSRRVHGRVDLQPSVAPGEKLRLDQRRRATMALSV
jgi:hypothetical protein